MTEQFENNKQKKKNVKPFLGLPGAVWTTNDLYIRFPNPINSSLDTLSNLTEEKGNVAAV